MKVYACGNCGGSLDIDKKTSVIDCGYCGYVNETTSMEEDLNKFKEEVANWLSGLGAVGGSSVDIAMRKRYFQDSIYPSILTEFSNLIGDTEDVLDFPTLYLRIFNRIAELKAKTKWSPQQGKPLKNFARKLESEEFLGFVSDPESQWLVHELRFRSLSIPMLMDVITNANDPNTQTFIQSSNTLATLGKEAENLAKVANTRTVDWKSYYDMLSRRLKVTSEAFKTFADTVETGQPADNKWLDAQISSLVEIRQELGEMPSLSVTDRVFLESGLDNDINALTAAFNVTNLYPRITKVKFQKYMTAIEALSDATLFKMPQESVDHLSWFEFGMDSKKLSWFLSILHTTINRQFFQIFAEPADIGMWIKKQKNVRGYFLYPFYLSRIKTILKSGFLLWKKGAEETFFSLCDAAFNLSTQFLNNDFPSLMTPGFKKIIGSKRERVLHSLMDSEGKPKPENWVVLPPTVTPSDIQLLYTTAHNFLEEAELSIGQGSMIRVPRSYKKKGFDPGKVKALSVEVSQIVYLPLAITSKGPSLLGQHLGLDCDLRHRELLCHAYMGFLSSIKST